MPRQGRPVRWHGCTRGRASGPRRCGGDRDRDRPTVSLDLGTPRPTPAAGCFAVTGIRVLFWFAGNVMQRLLALLSAAICAVGCSTWKESTIAPEGLTAELQAKPTKPLKPHLLTRLGAPVQPEYKIQPGDLLEVAVPDVLAENQI